ncbi:MAG TPA: hypothetical protein VMT79_03550 [Candidatus Binatia bacterium]|nr:hypothetical protein [Candidatus Binatia bacterium]
MARRRKEEREMKNLGIVAIAVGILLILLTLAGVIGQESPRVAVIGAAVILVVGIFLYRRHPAGS